MELDIVAWHWLLLGLVLVIFELFLPSFTALWFGVGAFITGILLWFIPSLLLELQIVIWAIFSIVFTVLWFKVLKPLSVDKTKAGLPREAIIGQKGIVISIPGKDHTGIIRFTIPVLGADEWHCRSQDTLHIGDRVTVIDILGNDLIVSKL